MTTPETITCYVLNGTDTSAGNGPAWLISRRARPCG